MSYIILVYIDTKIINHEEESIEAVERFLADHRFFVEPACGASLAAVYSSLIQDIELGDGPIVIEVCGGSAVSLELIDTWKTNAYKPH